MGDSVMQFSLVIGLFMGAMGLGSWLSRFAENNLEQRFITLQLGLALLGGLSAVTLYFAFAWLDNYWPFLLLVCIGNGTMIGLEIPIIIRILKVHLPLKQNVSDVLTADYIGAVVASLLFPLILIPQLGVLQTGVVFGLLNVVVASLAIKTFWPQLTSPKSVAAAAGICGAVLVAALISTNSLIGLFETKLYPGEIIHASNSPYQRIVITKDQGITNLYLNGNLQFSTADEYRYHESLVHPAMTVDGPKARVLLLGGGDGMAARELLKYPQVESLTVVDLDPMITDLFSDNVSLKQLNDNALNNPKVTIVNQDAWTFVESQQGRFDVVIADLPDPNNLSLSRLYSREFYTLLSTRMADDGVFVTQATSPLYARHAFWSIVHSIEAVQPGGLVTRPYHAYVPTFGEWGFVMASKRPLAWPTEITAVKPRFLSPAILAGLQNFAPDIAETDADVNTLIDHPLVNYYEKGWEQWFRHLD